MDLDLINKNNERSRMSDFTFNIIDYLEDKGIAYLTEGKNVSYGWININCPFCEDNSTHLGINLTGYGFNCWVCGEHGYITKLLRQLEGRWQIEEILEEYKEVELTTEKNIIKIDTSDFFLPKESSITPSRNHFNYLKNRNFDIIKIVNKYNIRFCDMFSKNWKHRIIIPVYRNKQLVSFSSRDITGKAEFKYKHCPNDFSPVKIKNTLYNIDNCKLYSVLAVEGAIDVWRMGDNCVGTFGTQLTLAQLFLFKQFRRVFILFDATAREQAQKFAEQLSGIVKEIHIIKLDKGDPAELSDEEANYIKQQFL